MILLGLYSYYHPTNMKCELGFMKTLWTLFPNEIDNKVCCKTTLSKSENLSFPNFYNNSKVSFLKLLLFISTPVPYFSPIVWQIVLILICIMFDTCLFLLKDNKGVKRLNNDQDRSDQYIANLFIDRKLVNYKTNDFKISLILFIDS